MLPVVTAETAETTVLGKTRRYGVSDPTILAHVDHPSITRVDHPASVTRVDHLVSVTRVDHPCRSRGEFGEGGGARTEDNWYSKGLIMIAALIRN